jgi:hypothetical protein
VAPPPSAIFDRKSPCGTRNCVNHLQNDPNTFRLTGLLTSPSSADRQAQGLQNLGYTYDPVGNITQIEDSAQQTKYFSNAVVKPESLYEYDAIIGNTDLAFIPQLPHSNSADAVRNYVEEYEYDLLGNIKTLRHRFPTQPTLGNGWTRHYR